MNYFHKNSLVTIKNKKQFQKKKWFAWSGIQTGVENTQDNRALMIIWKICSICMHIVSKNIIFKKERQFFLYD